MVKNHYIPVEVVVIGVVKVLGHDANYDACLEGPSCYSATGSIVAGLAAVTAATIVGSTTATVAAGGRDGFIVELADCYSTMVATASANSAKPLIVPITITRNSLNFNSIGQAKVRVGAIIGPAIEEVAIEEVAIEVVAIEEGDHLHFTADRTFNCCCSTSREQPAAAGASFAAEMPPQTDLPINAVIIASAKYSGSVVVSLD